MNLVIVHYHLNRGGVTSVIRNQIEALAGNSTVSDVLILHGKGTTGWSSCENEPELEGRLHRIEFQEIAQLGYQSGVEQDGEIADRVSSEILNRGFDPAETLIQIHNHNLGKNNSLMAAIPNLVSQWGYKVLLQIHDFPEDMRPDNFVAIREFCNHNRLVPTEILFPDDPYVHFAFLNQRDMNLVREQFVPVSRCHLLPNPISEEPLKHERKSDAGTQLSTVVRQSLECEDGDRLAVYPVRAIRRKNIGEALLFAAANRNLKVAITLPAVSKDEVTHYKNFKEAASRLNLPVVFDAGQKGLEFSAVISAADSILTTSVAEGFGMVFLESWSWGKQLIGRDLPAITHDFVEAGLNLDGLYDELKIPIDWIHVDTECNRQQELFRKVLNQFGIESKQEIQLAKEREQGWIDFAKLCHQTQLGIIEKVWLDDECKSMLLDWNPRFSPSEFDTELVSKNAHTVKEHFTQKAFCRRFQAVLDQMFSSTCDKPSSVSADRPTQEFLVQAFLDPENFYPLRIETE